MLLWAEFVQGKECWGRNFSPSATR